MIERKFFTETILVLVFVMTFMTRTGSGAKILLVAPFPAISHYQMMEPLMLSLAQRGHHITIFSHFPQKDKIENVTVIDLRGTFPPFELDFTSWSIMDDMHDLFAIGQEQCKMFASSDKVQNFLKTSQKFDLIFIEAFDSDCYLGWVAKFKAPLILFSAMALPVWESDWIYNPTEPSYLPDNLCRLSGKMKFFDRLQNIGCHLLFRFLHRYYNTQYSLEIIRKFFLVDLSDLDQLKRNVSLIFVNSFFGISEPRPFFPNVLEIGGIHIKPSKPLPSDIQSFLNGSQDGAIIISMGSIVKSHTLKPEVRNEFLSVISKLKERVLWKWEVDLPNKSNNLLTVPWFPQSDVLGHPKVKVFISHGGIHGLFESIFHGVPIIGIPLFGDQTANLKALEAKGAAVLIDFDKLNEENLSRAIHKVLGNESYKANAERLSRIFRDRPQTPLQKAIFWTEHVIRHGGAPHFQSAASELSWIQYALIDVLFVGFSFFILTIVVFHYSLKFLRII